MNHTHSEAAAKPPFDMAKPDQLMGEADLDVLVATSRHNVQYLLGGYRFFFFDAMDAIGVSRYCLSSFIKGAGPKTRFMSAIAWRVSSASWEPFRRRSSRRRAGERSTRPKLLSSISNSSATA